MTNKTKKILAGVLRFTISFALSSSVTVALLTALTGCTASYSQSADGSINASWTIIPVEPYKK